MDTIYNVFFIFLQFLNRIDLLHESDRLLSRSDLAMLIRLVRHGSLLVGINLVEGCQVALSLTNILRMEGFRATDICCHFGCDGLHGQERADSDFVGARG